MRPQDAERHFLDTLRALNLDATQDDELSRTPARFTQMLAELTASLHTQPPPVSVFPAKQGPPDPVLVCALRFHSICVHHLVPFFGTMDIAYIPGDSLIGFGGVGRVVDHFARRPQVQERLVKQIGEHLEETLQPAGLLVRCRARQLCVELRGLQKRALFVSSYSSGALAGGPQRDEVLRQFAAQEVEP